MWFHNLQVVDLWALQVWGSAQYAQAYCMLLGTCCTLLQLLRAGLGPLRSSRAVPGTFAAVCTTWHGHLAHLVCLANALQLAMLCC